MPPPRRQTLARFTKAMRMALSSRQYFGHAVRLAASCVTRNGRAQFARNLHSIALAPVGRVDYPTWIRDRIAERAALYPLPDPDTTGTGCRFSFLTTVYETKGRYVLALYETVKAQTCTDFEWVLLDNGSTRPDTLAAIDELRKDPRVRFERVEENLGILGGISTCLRRATGRYVVPLDSDDLLTPDALQVLAHVITEANEPPLLYSDEDKIKDDPTPFQAYHKPAWDPVLFWNSCYIAHLCAIRRDLALQLGVYTDDEAKGCHDWDTFFRFLSSGHTPLHVPEVLYSWRMHPQSCAGNIYSKSYVYDSHRHVLDRNLAMQPSASLLELRQSPLFPDTPDWWVARRHTKPPPISALFLRRNGGDVPAWLRQHPLVHGIATADANDLRDLDQRLAPLRAHDPDGKGLVLVCCEGTEPADDEGLWDAIALCERFPDTAVVGGRLLTPDEVVWSAGEVFGYHGLVGTPDRGRQAFDPGYFAWLRKQRSASSVHGVFCLVRADFLRDFAAQQHPASLSLLGAWLGAHAQDRDRRVVFTPLLTVRVPPDAPASENAPREEQARLLRRYPRVLDGERAYSAHLGLDPFDGFAAVYPAVRQRHLVDLREQLLRVPVARPGDPPAARGPASV
jgi:hypothetical protein